MRRSFGITKVSSIVSPFSFLDLDFVGSGLLGSGLGVNRSLEGSSTFAFFIVSSDGSFIIIFSFVFIICVKVFSGPNAFFDFIDLVPCLGSCKIESLMEGEGLAKVVFFIFS